MTERPTFTSTAAGAAGRTEPLLIYDGDCAFCTSTIRLAERWLQPACMIKVRQEADFLPPHLQRRALDEVLWITSSGVVHGGAAAVARLFAAAGGAWPYVGAIMTIRPFSWVASGLYAVIARNRSRLPGGSPACVLPSDQRPGEHAA